MAKGNLDGIQACVFDAYGTLFDFNSAAERCRDDLGDKTDELSAIWRTKQLQYTWLRSLMGAYVPFWQVTGEALDFAMESLDVVDPGLRDRLMGLYLDIDAFPEVLDVLRRLKDGGLKVAILSNGSPEMLKAGAEHTGIDGLLDGNLSVDDVGIFKPDSRVYQMACDRLGVDANQICFQSSNAWDAHGGSAFGYRVAWVNRYGQRRERLPGEPDVELRSLSELPPLLGL